MSDDMTTITPYRFRKASLADLDLVAAWQSNPHVSEWWDTDEPYSAEDVDDDRVERWIVSFDERPFAYMQDYTVHGWDDHPFASLPKGSRGIDQFIGEPDMLGIGHGSIFIRMRMNALFDQGAPMIATDPHPDNKRAIAAYSKLGFEPSGPALSTAWGLVLPMVARQ